MSERARLKGLVMAGLLVVAAITSFWITEGGSVLSAPASQVSTGTATVSPDGPGAATRFTVSFTTSTGQLNPGTDQFVITLSDDWLVPNTLDRSQITINASHVSNPSNPGTFPSDAVAPQSVSVDFVGTEDANPEIIMTVPDMLVGTNGPAIGSQGIAAGATVTVVFQHTAGIRNPLEGGDYDVLLATSADPGLITVGTVTIPFILELSTDAASRGAALAVVGLGFKDGQTSTFWLDVDGDGVRDSGERDLCSVVTSDDFIATCTFAVSNPPFQTGTGPDCAFTSLGATFDCNHINARDGLGRTASQRNQADIDRSVFTLRSTVQATPNTARVGDRITIFLVDYPQGGVVNQIALGGVAITAASSPSLASLTSGLHVIPPSGQQSFAFSVPGVVDGIRIPTGAARLRVFTDNGTGDTNRFTDITILGADLTLFQQEVIGNQDLIISGEHFTTIHAGRDVCVLENDITLSNVPLKIDIDSLDSFCEGKFPGRSGIEVSSGGTFMVTVRLESTDGTIPTALFTPGTHELKVIDTNGAEGTINVTIPQRKLEVTPPAARPRDIITVTGQKFIADNPDGVSVSVQVEYDCGPSSRTVTAVPDSFGNFLVHLAIPSDCAIPSTNAVSAEIIAGGISTGVVDTIVHEVPSAFITVAPVSGTSGSRVTVSGFNFQSLTTVADLRISGLDVTPLPPPITDGNGEFQATFQLPLLTPGIHLVEATAGAGATRLRAITTFTVTNVPQAEPSFELFQEPADGATGLNVDVIRIFDPNTGIDVAVLLGGFQTELTYDGTCINILAFREMDFTLGASNINDAVGIAAFNGFSTAGTSPPADVGHALTRLVGSAIQPCQLDLGATSLTDHNGGPIDVPTVLSQPVLRGDARGDGTINIADALFIAQYLVGLRNACSVVVDTNCLHSVNAASVQQDGLFDLITIADALFIAQYLAGLRDEFYNLIP